jgi:sec-independent protein translocase protein TatA
VITVTHSGDATHTSGGSHLLQYELEVGDLPNLTEASVGEGLFQPMHLLVIFFVALLVFGPKKLPELGKGIGDGIRELKKGLNDATSSGNEQKSSEIKKA